MALLKGLLANLVLVLAPSWCHAATAVQLTGTTISIDNASYYWIPPTPVGELDMDTTAKFLSTAA